jgi:hypothetical protein
MASTFPAPPEALFAAANGLALTGWLALAVSPAGTRRAPAARVYAGRVLPLLFAALYVLLFSSQGFDGGGYGSLAEVQRLLANPLLLAAGWLHYLAFDLFVGAWIAERAGVRGWPHALVLPLLALTFLFGPAGLLACALLGVAWRRRGAPAA